MLFKFKQILDRKRWLISSWLLVSTLLVTFSPFVSAVIENQAMLTGSGVTIMSSNSSVEIVASNIKSNQHCQLMLQANNCDTNVCCPALPQLIESVQVHPTIETHKLFSSSSNYQVILATEIKPPILSHL